MFSCWHGRDRFQIESAKGTTVSVFYNSRLKSCFYWKDDSQELLMPQMLKLAKLLLVMPAANTREVIFYNVRFQNIF